MARLLAMVLRTRADRPASPQRFEGADPLSCASDCCRPAGSALQTGPRAAAVKHPNWSTARAHGPLLRDRDDLARRSIAAWPPAGTGVAVFPSPYELLWALGGERVLPRQLWWRWGPGLGPACHGREPREEPRRFHLLCANRQQPARAEGRTVASAHARQETGEGRRLRPRTYYSTTYIRTFVQFTLPKFAPQQASLERCTTTRSAHLPRSSIFRSFHR